MALSKRTYAAIVLVAMVVVVLSGGGFLALSVYRAEQAFTGLYSDDPATRDAAVAALAKSRAPYVVDRLIALFTGEKKDSPLREAAMSALVGIGPHAVAQVVVAAHPGASPRGAGGIGPPVEPARLRADASQIVMLIGAPAARPLLALVKDEHSTVRAHAAELLGMLKSPDLVDGLLPLLEDSSIPVRRSAIHALGRCGGVALAGRLITILGGSRIATCRAAAAQALGEIGDQGAVKPLVTALRDTEGEVRNAAAQALGRISHAGAVKSLIVCLDDSDVRIRESAAKALGEIADRRAVEPLIISLRDGLPRSPRLPPTVSGHIAWGVYTHDRFRRRSYATVTRGVRAAAAEALGRIADRRAVRPLISRLGDSDSQVRISAALALASFKDTRAVGPLLALLKSRNLDVRSAAVFALSRMRDVRVVEPFVGLLSDAEGDIRRQAAETLGRIGGARAVEPLIDALGDEDVSVRNAAAEALGKIGDPVALEPLLVMLQSGYTRTQQIALAALWGFDEPRVVAAIKPLLRYERGELAWRAAATLERIGTREAREAVDEFIGIDLADVARDRRAYIEAGDESDMWLLMLALERHGTLDMAADLLHCGHPNLSHYAAGWAERHDLLDKLEASKDSPERPKWGRGASSQLP